MDLNAIRKKMNSFQKSSEKREKIDYEAVYWRPKKEGKYQIRIVPSKYNPSDPFTEFFIHYKVGKFPFAALTNWGEKDPIVEFCKKLRKDEDREAWKMAGTLEPRMRVFVPVIVRGEEDKGVRLWQIGKELYIKFLEYADDEDYGDYTDVNEGRDFTVNAVNEVAMGKEYLKCSITAKPKTTPLSKDEDEIEKWLEEQPNVMEIQRKYDYDVILGYLKSYLNPEEEEEQVEEEEEEEEVKPTPPPSKKYSPSTPKSNKSSKTKFEDLFADDDEDEEGGDVPF